MEETRKRISPVRPGNVYTLELPDGQRVVFHFLIRDVDHINAAIIRVFRKRYQPSEVIYVDEALKDEIDFYCHLYIKSGILDGKIVKIGYRKFSDISQIDDVYFLSIETEVMGYGTPDDWLKARYYMVRSINKPLFSINELPRHIIDCGKLSLGDVVHYGPLIKRCVDGHWDPFYFPEKFWPPRHNNS